MNATPLQTAQARIADCLQLNEQGQLVQRRDHLNLSGLELSDAELTARFDPQERGLPEISLASLPHLRYLDLTGNQLTELPECVTGFTGLVWLGLNFNRITKLPEKIGALVNLQRLYVRENGLKALPVGFGKLRSLVELDAHGNRIAEPPVSLLPLLGEQRDCGPLFFDVADNGSEWSEIVAASEGTEKQRAALANYLRQMQAGAAVLAQGKLLLVGEGGVGKTTLLDVLDGKPYNDHTDTTHGLELRPLRFKPEDGWQGTLHAWDFSGQPTMRQTHQLFFTTPALYLLVWNHREAREAETSAEIVEWLTLIDQRTQGEGRVLLIAKKAKDRSAEPPYYADILRRFGPKTKGDADGVLLPEACLKVDSEGTQAAEQVRALRERIAAYADRTPSFNEPRPENWIAAQQHFQQKRATQPYLEWNDFVSECQSLGLADAGDYAKAQHRLGTLVWVDTERLRHVDLSHGEPARQLVVLNPDWLSKAIGFVIERDDKDRRSGGAAVPASPAGVSSGLVSAAQMDAIWAAPPQPKQGAPLVFPEPLFAFFRQLMRDFDIARPVRQKGTPGAQWHLVPNRLPDSPPAAWQAAWRSDLPQVFWRVELRVENGDPLNHWLGLAVFYRLMIILHSEAQGRQDFAGAAHWRRGFMLAPAGGGLARIEFNGSDRRDAGRCVGFDIQVASHQPRELWAVFAEALGHLIHDLERHYGYTSIVVKRLVSCPASRCDREAARRCYIDEAFIATRAQSGGDGWRQQTTICNATGCGKDLPLGLLWDGRASDDVGRLGRIESKLEKIEQCGLETLDYTRSLREDAACSAQRLSSLRAGLMDIQRKLVENALDSEVAVARVLLGQMELGRNLREAMERASEEMSSHLRELHLNLADPASDLPRFYTLMPVEKWKLPVIGRKEWRLWLHCEKTRYPAALVLPGKQGEFIIPESQAFLEAVAPYAKRVSTLLVALGPVTALLTTANTLVTVTPAIVLALAQWAKAYQTPVRRLASLLKEESEGSHQGMTATGVRPVLAEKAGLAWLHSFLRKDPSHRAKLGLVDKVDGQGRHWWVLPEVEV
jgi:hypothetical protein